MKKSEEIVKGEKKVIFYDNNGEKVIHFKTFYNIENDIQLEEIIYQYIKEINKQYNFNFLNTIYYTVEGE